MEDIFVQLVGGGGMSSDEENPAQEYAGYICFGSHADPSIRSTVHVTRDKEDADVWRLRARGEAKNDNAPSSALTETAVEPKQPAEAGESLSALMGRLRETLGAFYPLINASTVLMPSLRTGFIHEHMYGSAKSLLDNIESNEKYDIYGVNLEQYPKIGRQIRRLRELDRGMEVLPAAVLMGLVSTFDSGVADSVRLMINIRPDKFDNSSKNISVKDILQMENFEDVRQRIVDDEIDSLMRGGHEDQVDYIEKNFDIKIREHYPYWTDFIEIFERRNLAAHGDLRINKRYIQNLRKNGFKSDNLATSEKLTLDATYLKRSADTLLEFSLLLVFVLWRKSIPTETEAAYSRLSDEAYELIRDGRTRVAANLLDFALNKQKAQIPDQRRKVMIINLANALMKEGDESGSLAVLDATDWTACANEFRLCEASLRKDVSEFVRLMPLAASTVAKQDLRDWPVFDWVRQNGEVKAKFLEIYGEPFISDEASSFEEIALRLGDLAEQKPA